MFSVLSLQVFGYPVGVGIVRQSSNDYLILLLYFYDLETLYIVLTTPCACII